jgi:hypothetical protein
MPKILVDSNLSSKVSTVPMGDADVRGGLWLGNARRTNWINGLFADVESAQAHLHDLTVFGTINISTGASVVADITITNAPAGLTNAVLSVNGVVISWNTNGLLSAGITNSAAQAATNLANAVLTSATLSNAPLFNLILSLHSNTVTFTALDNCRLVISNTSPWASLVMTTNAPVVTPLPGTGGAGLSSAQSNTLAAVNSSSNSWNTAVATLNASSNTWNSAIQPGQTGVSLNGGTVATKTNLYSVVNAADYGVVPGIDASTNFNAMVLATNHCRFLFNAGMYTFSTVFAGNGGTIWDSILLDTNSWQEFYGNGDVVFQFTNAANAFIPITGGQADVDGWLFAGTSSHIRFHGIRVKGMGQQVSSNILNGIVFGGATNTDIEFDQSDSASGLTGYGVWAGHGLPNGGYTYCDYVTLNGMTITNCGNILRGDYGAVLDDADHFRCLNANIAGCFRGFEFGGSDHALLDTLVQNTSVIDCSQAVVFINNGTANAYQGFTAANNSFLWKTNNAEAQGVLWGGGGVAIRDFTLSHNAYRYTGTNYANNSPLVQILAGSFPEGGVVDGESIEHGPAGLYIYGSPGLPLYISHLSSSSNWNYGVYCAYTTNVVLQDSTATNNNLFGGSNFDLAVDANTAPLSVRGNTIGTQSGLTVGALTVGTDVSPIMSSATVTGTLTYAGLNVGAPFVVSGNTYPVLTNPPYNIGFDTSSGAVTASFWLAAASRTGGVFSAFITNGANPLVILGLATNEAAGGTSSWDSGSPPTLIHIDDWTAFMCEYAKTSGKLLNTKWRVTSGNIWSNQTGTTFTSPTGHFVGNFAIKDGQSPPHYWTNIVTAGVLTIGDAGTISPP